MSDSSRAARDKARIEYLTAFLPLARAKRLVVAREALDAAVLRGDADCAYCYAVISARTRRKS